MGHYAKLLMGLEYSDTPDNFEEDELTRQGTPYLRKIQAET